MKIITQVKVAACTASIHGFNPSNTDIEKAAAIDTVARIFALRLIAPDARQSAIGGPSVGCSINQLWNRSDDRAKQNAASNRNGTVGNSGSTTPIMARPTQMKPLISQIIRITET